MKSAKNVIVSVNMHVCVSGSIFPNLMTRFESDP